MAQDEARSIQLMDDQPPCCMVCGRRLDVAYHEPVDADDDGPIYRATCSEHGDSLVQQDPNPDEPF